MQARQSLFVVTLSLLAGSAAAQVLEEVVVTAQKREQGLQDVGISVTAFSAEQIRALGLTSSIDIGAQTPGLQFVETSDTLGNLTNIRGVSQNSFDLHQEAPNAVYVDQAYVSVLSAMGFQMFDLERVEVLRGPQGTLFGRNATGGLVHYLSRAPAREPEGYGDLRIGAYESARFEGAVAGPVGETLSARIAAVIDHSDDYFDNDVGRDYGGRDDYGLRGRLRWEPVGAVRADLIAAWGEQDHDINYVHGANGFDADGLEVALAPGEPFYFPPGVCDGCDPSGYRKSSISDPYERNEQNTDGFFESEALTLTGILAWDLGGVTLTSVTNYLDYEASHLEDGEQSPRAGFDLGTNQNAEQVTQELRLHGETERFNWTAGFYYMNREAKDREMVDVGLAYLDDLFSTLGLVPPGLLGGFGTELTLDSAWRLDTESWALFGQAEYAFSARWSLLLGLRYSEDDLDYVFDSVEAIDGFPIGPGGVLGQTSFADARSDGEWSGKVELDWRPNEDWLLYASFSRGAKGAGYNAPFLGGVVLPFDGETLDSYEAGFKATLLDGRARLNASGFHYEYSDYQGFSFVNLATLITNLDADADGVEVELAATPAAGWDLLLGMSWLDARVHDVVLPSGRLTDREMPVAPELSLNGLLRYSWPLWHGTGALQADFSWNDAYYSEVLNNPAGRVDERVVGNLRASYTTGDERWEIALLVRNVADADSPPYRIPTGLGINQEQHARPRWVSGQLIHRF